MHVGNRREFEREAEAGKSRARMATTSSPNRQPSETSNLDKLQLQEADQIRMEVKANDISKLEEQSAL